MCINNSEIIEEFLRTVEKSIGESQSQKELNMLNTQLTQLEAKIQKLIGLHLDGAIDRANYENKFIDLNRDKENLVKELNELSFTVSEEKAMTDRLKAFRKDFDDKKPLKKFDAIVDYVILGGVDENGRKDSYLLTLILKIGLKPRISVKKEPKSKSKNSLIEIGKKLCFKLSNYTC